MSAPKSYFVDESSVSRFEDIDLSITYSYASYLTWLFEDRVELINGKVFKMSPAPSSIHQAIVGNLFLKLGNFLKKKSCRVFVAPFDVRFPKESKADAAVFTVLQPDICVICDKTKIDYNGCIGAPDIVVEILSPGNNLKELLTKYKIYEEFGVKEYWVVSQSDQSILIYTLIDGKFHPSKIFTLSEKITSLVLPGFKLVLDDVFEGLD